MFIFCSKSNFISFFLFEPTTTTKTDETGYITSSTTSDVEDQNSVQSDCGVTIIMENVKISNNLNHSCNSNSSCSAGSQNNSLNDDEDSFLYNGNKLVNNQENSSQSSCSFNEWCS